MKGKKKRDADNKIELRNRKCDGPEKIPTAWAINGKEELYGFERFRKSIEEGRALGTDGLLERLVSDVFLCEGKIEQHDDLTAIVVKVE